MIFEIRLYTIVPGRIDVHHERFGKLLPPVFARHGIRNVGRWTASAGPNGPMWVYLMAYRDLAEREAQWAGFYADDEWWDIRARTQGDEEATERFDIHFLRASPIWRPDVSDPARTVSGPQDLVFIEIPVGKAKAANDFLAQTYLPALVRAGGELMMVTDFISGPNLPRMALMVAWPGAAEREAGWRAIRADEAVTDAIARQRRELGRAALGRTDTWLLDPLADLPPLAALGAPLE